ncbi:MAG: DinB family protein [Vicinamibacterales bacterium]
MTHEQRIAATAAAFEAAMSRLLLRLEEAPDAVAERTSADGGWSAAGIVWHVAVTNEQFAGLVDGSVPGASPPEADFEETPFSEITSIVPDQLEAPSKFHPPAGLTRVEALERARASRDRMSQAIRTMPESRGFWTVKSILGMVTVYQVGEWATAHVARHNRQSKRAIESSVDPVT